MSGNNWKFSEAGLSKVEEVAGFDAEQPYTIAWYGQAAFDPADFETSLSTNWDGQQGAFLFVKATYVDLDTDLFKEKLRAYLNAPLRKHLSLLWLDNPSDPINEWRANSISTTTENDAIRVSQVSYLDIRNYSFSVAGKTKVSVNESSLVFDRDGNPHGFELAASFGRHRMYDISETVTLPMTGSKAGCIQFALDAKKEARQETVEVDEEEVTTSYYGYPALPSLDMSLRMFMRDSDFPESGSDFYLSSHRYPFFTEESDYAPGDPYYRSSISFQVYLDLLYPLREDRCYFGLPLIIDAEPGVDDLGDLGYPTAYRTNLGYTVHVVPTDTSKFVFALRSDLLCEDALATASLYLTPSGDFDLKIPRYRDDASIDYVDEASLICGISGVEYIRIDGRAGSVIHFTPGQPAYLPNYLSVVALMRDLGPIIESYSNRKLLENTTDQDMPIEDKQEGEATEAMGITDVERKEILEIIRKDYFPPGYQFTEKATTEYMNLEIVEEMIEWLRATLQAATFDNAVPNTILSSEATTSWAYLTSAEGAIYYAQPDQAILYKADPENDTFLDFMEVPAVGLPASLTTDEAKLLVDSVSTALAFPMLPYGFVDRNQLTDLRQLEIQLISTFRRDRIQFISTISGDDTPLVLTEEVVEEVVEEEETTPAITYQGTTPQGLLATFPEDYSMIQELMLARDTEDEEIKLVNIDQGSKLKASIQSNQLFMVSSDPDALKDYFSTQELDQYIADHSGGGEVVKATNRLTIAEWIFELGPYGEIVPVEEEDEDGTVTTVNKAIEHWNKKGTILIFKFHDKPLIELVEDPSMWSFAGDFNVDAAKTSRTLKRLLKEAVESGKSDDAKERRKYEVLARAATYAGWSGVIALNVDVPLGNLPDSLKALAAGINADEFYSQYVGIEVTQMHSDDGVLVPQQSSLFGLIDYNNNNIPLADESGYNFHVRFLTVVFQNSQITDFAAEILLILDKLFDEKTTLLDSPDGRNIIVLKGVAEEHNGETTYSFGFSGANRFQLSGKVIEEVEIVKAQFTTDPIPAADTDGNLAIKGRFSLWGRMRFAYLEGFDILSFGAYPQDDIAGSPAPTDESQDPDYLNMSNLQIVMSFKMNEVTGEVVGNKSFSFDPNRIAYDLKRSGWRKHSLFEKFPLKFKTIRYVANDANALTNSGFMLALSGLEDTLSKDDIGSTWYSLEYDLNMGSIGSLAGGAGLTVGIMAAWKPEEKGLYIGLKLPGSSGGKKEISIQGVLKIVFKHIQFVTYPLVAGDDLTDEEKQQVGYLLKLKNIVLKFFVVSFPPVGKTEIILFGDPREEVAREDKLVGWYAAYVK